MLLESNYKNGDTISLKLSSGEEMVGRLEKEDENQISIKKPMVIIAAQQGLALSPFMFSATPDAKFVIKQSNIMCVTKTIEEIGKQYTQQTTGIVT